MQKIILSIMIIICNGLFADKKDNVLVKNNRFGLIVSKYEKTPNAGFRDDVDYVKSHLEELSKEKLFVKVKVLRFLAATEPDMIIRWVNDGEISKVAANRFELEFLIPPIIDVFKSQKEKKALMMLKKILTTKKYSPKIIFYAGVAYDFISGDIAKEKYDKSTPELFILSLSNCVNGNKGALVSDDEKEFYIYPRYCDDFWKNEQKPKMMRAKSEVDKFHRGIVEMANDITHNNGKNVEFVKQKDDSVEVRFKNKRKFELHQDCFGQWRF